MPPESMEIRSAAWRMPTVSWVGWKRRRRWRRKRRGGGKEGGGGVEEGEEV